MLILSFIVSNFTVVDKNNFVIISQKETVRQEHLYTIPEKEKDIVVKGSELDNNQVEPEKQKDAEWNLKMIGADVEQPTPDKKVKIAVLDSGIDDSGEYCVYKRNNLIPGEERLESYIEDSTGHGTAIAGLIAAKEDGKGITGINPNVQLYSIKVLDENNQAPLSRVVEGIYLAVDEGVQIINMSFGTSVDSKALHQAIQYANQKGVLLVAAAGNQNTAVEYPAAYEEVIGVGSVDAEGIRCEDCASGNGLDIMAPGDQIKTVGLFGGESIKCGTSMAVPHVVAAASLLWQKDMSKSNQFIKGLLLSSAKVRANETNYGRGILDVEYALEQYNLYEKNYVEDGVDKQIISDNYREMTDLENVNYVNGRWTQEDHKNAIVDNASDGDKLTDSQINIIKKGVIENDVCKVTSSLLTNPEWHGGYKGNNYVACYLYITDLALAARKGKKLADVKLPKGFSEDKAKSMRQDLYGIAWKDGGTAKGYNDEKKSLFIWGMAIHIGMDAYAHNAFLKDKTGKWYHATHPEKGNGLAENRKDIEAYAEERYNTACRLARKSIKKWKLKSGGDVKDFNPEGGYKGAGTKWKIANLFTNINKFDESVAKKLKAYSISI